MNKKGTVGLLTLGIGIGLLLFTFYTAYRILTQPEMILPFSRLAPTPLIYFVPLGLLAVMISIGGRIIRYGMELLKDTWHEGSGGI